MMKLWGCCDLLALIISSCCGVIFSKCENKFCSDGLWGWLWVMVAMLVLLTTEKCTVDRLLLSVESGQ